MTTKRFFSHQITVTGLTATGTSTIEKGVREHFEKHPFRYVSAGGIMRTFARQRNMTIEEFAAYNLAHPEEGYDKRCDDMIGQFATHNHVFIEGRLPHYFAPHAFHILVHCDLDLRAFRRMEQGSYPGKTQAEVKKLVAKRDHDDGERYVKLYKDCMWPESKFNLVLNTGNVDKVEMVRHVIEAHEHWLKRLPPEQVVHDVLMAA